MSFLIEQYDNLLPFLDAYSKTDDPKTKATLLYNFVNFKKISKFKQIFKGSNDEDPTVLNDKLLAIKFFAQIPQARFNYLYKLVEEKTDFIDKNTVII